MRLNPHKVTMKLLDHEERLEWIERNSVMKQDIDKINILLENQAAILRRLDDERLVTAHRMDRIEGEIAGMRKEFRTDIDALKTDMVKVKEKLFG